MTERAAYIGRVRNLARERCAALPRAGGRWRRCCLRSAARSCPRRRAARPRRSCRRSRAGARQPNRTSVFVGPRRLARAIVDDLPEQTADEWVKGPPVATAGEGRRRASRSKHGVDGRGARRARRLPRRANGRAGRSPTCCPNRLDAIVRGLSFSKTMRWDDSGLRFPRPVRWRLAMLDSETRGRRRALVGHRFSHGSARDRRTPTAYADGSARGRRRARRRGAAAPDRRGPRRASATGATRPACWPRSCTSWSSRPCSTASFDERFLQLPERVVDDDDAVAPALLPAGRQPVRVRRRTAAIPRSCGPATRTCSRGTARGRARSRSSATCEVGIDAPRRAARRDHLLQGRRLVRGQDRAARRLVEELGGGEATLEAARLAKADQASELVREFPDLEGHIGAEYARLAGYPEAVAAAIEEQYLPDAAGRAAAADRGRPRARRRGQDRHARTIVLASGNGRPARATRTALRRAAIGLNRLAVEGGAAGSRATCSPSEVRRVRRGAARGPARGAGRVRARRARARRRPTSAASPGSRRRSTPSGTSPAFDGVYTAYERAHRLAGAGGRRRRDRGRSRPAQGGRGARPARTGSHRSTVDGDVRRSARVAARRWPR